MIGFLHTSAIPCTCPPKSPRMGDFESLFENFLTPCTRPLNPPFWGTLPTLKSPRMGSHSRGRASRLEGSGVGWGANVEDGETFKTAFESQDLGLDYLSNLLENLA
jgi:hypothetical protein